MNKNFLRHGSEGFPGIAPGKDDSGLAKIGRCSYKTSAPIPNAEPSSFFAGQFGCYFGVGVLSPVVNVPGWRPVMTVVASKTTTVGRSPRTVRWAGNCVTRGLRALDRLTVLRQAKAPNQSPALPWGMVGAFGMDRSSVLNEAGRGKESGEGKGIQ